MIYRSGWGANDFRHDHGPVERLMLPVSSVVIFHTAQLQHCHLTEECCESVRFVQNLHQREYLRVESCGTAGS